MIRYATEKYGEERVAQIITYGTIKAKAAVKDSARVLGYPYALGDRITKAMPPAVMGKDIPLAGHLRPRRTARYAEAGEFRDAVRGRPRRQDASSTPRKGLEGLKRQWGVHAAGVILCREPLLDVIPIQRREQDGAIITQFDMGACETLGLLKMDFLGLRNLTVLDDCLRHIEHNRGETVVLEDARRSTTSPTYELLARGDTLGVFQLDGGADARRCCARCSRTPSRTSPPSLALYRPGPMGANAHNDYADRKNGRKPVVPIHPELAEPLAEHPRRHLRPDRLPGAGHGDRAAARRLLASAPPTCCAARWARRRRRSSTRSTSRSPSGMRAQRLLRKARSRRCGTSSSRSPTTRSTRRTPPATGWCRTGRRYLKANYPAEYMAALLTSRHATTRTSRRSTWTSAGGWASRCCRPTSTSPTPTSPRVGTDIRFGLSAIRNVGDNVVESIVATRASQGPLRRLRRLPAQGRRRSPATSGPSSR